MKNLTEGEKRIRLLMRERPTCYDCPAADFCKNSNMSCDENRLQYVDSPPAEVFK